MLEKLISILYDNVDKAKAAPMAAYMKNQFPFLGIPKPDRIKLAKDFFSFAKKGKSINWEFIDKLWTLPEREFQYIGIDYLAVSKELLIRDDITRIEKLIIQKPWWDTVDAISSIMGWMCAKYPDLIESHILNWASSNNIWLVRIAILHQLKYKEKTNSELLSKIIGDNSQSNEFFINKAIGWALREYSKTNPKWVRQFLSQNKLQPLSVREGSKYL